MPFVPARVAAQLCVPSEMVTVPVGVAEPVPVTPGVTVALSVIGLPTIGAEGPEDNVVEVSPPATTHSKVCLADGGPSPTLLPAATVSQYAVPFSIESIVKLFALPPAAGWATSSALQGETAGTHA
jgi:hypothetical protein